MRTDGSHVTVTTRDDDGGWGCLGVPLAFCLSLKTWGWTWWLLLHTPLGWLYVIWWVVFDSGWIR